MQPKPALRRIESRPLSVGLLLAQDFTLSAFSLFVDTLRLAADDSDYSRPIHCRWTIMAETDAPIRSSCGVEILPGSTLLDPTLFDYIVVVGGILHNHPKSNTPLYAYLRRAAAAGTKLIGICTGSFILCRAGLMEGRRVCVSWLHYQDFRDEFPDHAVIGDRFFEFDGDRITCAGGAGAADLAAALVERHLGSRLAQKPHQVLLLTPMRGPEGVQPHPPMAHDVSDEQVRRALIMMEQNLGNPLQIAMIAQRLDLSTRQLERRFDTALGKRPSDLYRELRLRYARWLLETTTRSVTEIALDAGFSDCAHFSRQFKALHGLSPSLARPAMRRDAAEPGPSPNPSPEPTWADHDRVAVGAAECAGQRPY